MNNANPTVIHCANVGKTYADGKLRVEVVRHLNLSVAAGESVSIVGASGSGKSTLLHLLGGLDEASMGEIQIMGADIAAMSQKKLGQWRNQHLGFVYQFHHLLPEFSALENVMMPLLVRKTPKAQAREAAAAMLQKVGLQARMTHRPGELSGGERQRAAIARALVTHPACILADEPTGNLDQHNALKVLDLMLELKQQLHTALVVVTHDEALASRFERTLYMRDGVLD